LTILFVTAAGVVSAGGARSDSFIVPGVDFSRVSLSVGDWCRYVVVDEALDQTDTTDVYIGVPGRESSPKGPAYWVEIETRLRGAGEDGHEIMRMLVLEDIKRFADGDSLGRYVLRLYIKNGANPPQEEDPTTYEDFSLLTPTADEAWQIAQDVPTTTAAGEFTCTKKDRVARDDREYQTGDIKLVKKARDDYSVWFCEDVPVFHLVRCEIDRIRSTETIPPIAGMPVSGDKKSRTSAELVEFGGGAKPLLPIE